MEFWCATKKQKPPLDDQSGAILKRSSSYFPWDQFEKKWIFLKKLPLDYLL